MGEFRTLSFQDSVNAGSVKTLTSKIIGQPFYVRAAEVEFALGQDGLVQIEVAIDNDNSTPSTASANIGDSVMMPYSQATYLRGNNAVRALRMDKLYPQLPAWIKVRANNTDQFADHRINVLVQIEMLSAEELEEVTA